MGRSLRPGWKREEGEETSWEDLASEDAALPPLPKDDDDDGDEGIFDDDADRAELPALLARSPPPETTAIATAAAYEALVSDDARQVMVSQREFWEVRGEFVVVPLAEEFFTVAGSSVSTAALLRRCRSPSKFPVVQELKALAGACLRDPTWKATMADELEGLAAKCERRAAAYRKLLLARSAFLDRVALAQAAIDAAPDDQTHAERLVRDGLTDKIAKVDGLLRRYGCDDDDDDDDDEKQRQKSPPKGKKSQPPRPRERLAPVAPTHDDDATGYDADTERAANLDRVDANAPPKAREKTDLLDAIIAMILVRTPNDDSDLDAHRARLQRTHRSLVDAWRDQIGLLPSRIDATRDDDDDDDDARR